MKRKRMLTLTAFGSALLIWSVVCHAEPATAEPPKSPDGTAEASRSSDGNAGKECCPKALEGECCPVKGKCCAANAAKGCCAKAAKDECRAGKGEGCAANAAKGCCAKAAKDECRAGKGEGCAANASKGCSAVKGKNRPCTPVKQASCGGSLNVAKAAERLEKIGYSKEDIAALPASAILASAGSGYPVGFAGLKKGETVVDLGCGSGIDCLLAATIVGSEGHVIGVDRSPERIAAAKENKCKARLANVEFREGLLEKLPLEDESVDVAISNCVPPVMRGKDIVLREAFRVLKPGGRLVTTSGLVNDDAPAEALSPEGDWGARMGLPPLRQKDYFARLRAAGFAKVEIAAKSPTSDPHKSKLMVVATKGKCCAAKAAKGCCAKAAKGKGCAADAGKECSAVKGK